MNQHFFIGAEGNRLAYSVAGPEDGAPVFLFHGGGQTRHAWARSIEVLGARGWRAMAVDLRGHGDSDRATRYHASDFAADIHTLALAQSRPPVMIGASLGGISSLLANDMAQESHEISRALVLVDIAPRLNLGGVNRVLDFMRAHTRGFASLEEAADAIAAYQPQRAQRSNPDGLRKNLRLRDDGRWYWHWDPVMLEHLGRARDELHGEEILYRAATRLKQPVLLVRGAQSDVVDEDISREFSQRVPHARVADVRNAGHMVAGDRNDLFLDAVLGFLDEAAITPTPETAT